MKIVFRIVFILIIFLVNVNVYAYVEYKVGDKISYNEADFYVIEDSGNDKETVTMLKAEPLTVEEVNKYGEGHINRYTYDSVGTAYNQNGYGGMVYYSSENCGYVNDGTIPVMTDCKNTYETSDVKYAVDTWKDAEVPLATEARLITKEEIEDNLGIEEYESDCHGCGAKVQKISVDWVYNSNYNYWATISNNGIDNVRLCILSDGAID